VSAESRGRRATARRSRVTAAFAGLAAAAASWLLPSLALACTVCMSGQEEASRRAFVGTTAFMTFFPLLMLGLGIGWFVRRALAQEREEEAEARLAALRPADRPDVVHASR